MHIAVGLSVDVCVWGGEAGGGSHIYAACYFGTVYTRVLKIHVWIPHGKIVDTFIFLSELCPFLE